MLGATTVKNPRKADDRRPPLAGEVIEAVHDETEVCLGLGSQHTGGGEALVIDEGWVIAADPFHRVGWIRDDGIKGFVFAEVGLGQGVAQLHVELVVVHVMQKHVHPR